MFRKDPRLLLRLAAVASVVGAGAIFASPAAALNTGDQQVTGVATSNIALTIGGVATFGTDLQAGHTSTTSGTVTATSTSASPSLTVQDSTSTSNAGHMQLVSPLTCSASAPYLSSALSITGGSDVSSAFSFGSAFGLSGLSHSVASASAPVAADLITVNYSQAVGSSESLLGTCAYAVTATYTLS